MADDDDEDEKKKRVPDHLIRVLDGLAQEDDDLELDQAACSLTACIGKGRLVHRQVTMIEDRKVNHFEYFVCLFCREH